MAVDDIRLEFNNDFMGTMISPNGEVLLGNQDGGIMPYHLLFGALGSCFYATFLSIVQKKRLSFDSATLLIQGTKREEVPTTLNHVTLKLTVKNPSDEKQLRRSAKLGAKFCSVYETISKVATMELVVELI